MKITKFTHSCLLVETDAHAVLFDPGEFSKPDVASLPKIEQVFITHAHPDHMDVNLIKKLRERFPMVQITGPGEVRRALEQAGITEIATEAPSGSRFFAAPHESIQPLAMVEPPEEVGVHYIEKFTHPGDSHHFAETMPVLALPITAPWGAIVGAVRIALEVKPKYIIPIHDWHWREEALVGMYDRLEKRFAEEGIIFIKTMNGRPYTIEV